LTGSVHGYEPPQLLIPTLDDDEPRRRSARIEHVLEHQEAGAVRGPAVLAAKMGDPRDIPVRLEQSFSSAAGPGVTVVSTGSVIIALSVLR
jgi:hypothetical protein